MVDPMSSPRSIAFVITGLAPGGAERCLVELARGLDRGRFSPRVYSLQGEPSEDRGQLVAKLRAAEIPVTFLNASGYLDAPWIGERLLAEWQAHPPDLVQSFLFHANVMSAWVGMRSGVRRVVAGFRVLENVWWRRTVLHWSEPRFAAGVCVSQSVADDLSRDHTWPREKLRVIPNSVTIREPAAPIDLASLDIAPGRRALMSIGRLDPQKGFDWLLDLAPRLLAGLPRHDLLLVGSGPEEASLRRQTAELDLTKRVHFLGWRDDLASLLAATDLLLLPSRWEGMSNVLLEGMAAGRPVVAREVEGVREVIGPTAAEQIVPRDDSAAFVAKTIELATHPDRAATLGAANRDRASREFSPAKMIAAYEALYDKLLST